ncbi:Hypothetical predicted protein [Olea europaea subsp. europaea]|uniref:Uncharacterized protein n=1 Tax=Olea europaea subsp. europaea TaxID=158383 RepID=A0A8S0QYL7_OLEEU|nr:Hypothetical predicted protein [Olea europaea subsp. europaea]
MVLYFQAGCLYPQLLSKERRLVLRLSKLKEKHHLTQLFLFEWWSMFWDIFITRTNEKHSEVAAFRIEFQIKKAWEQQPQQQQQSQEQQQQVQMHQLNDPLTRQNPGTANALATKMYEDRLKLPAQTDSLNDVALKVRS